MHFLGFCILLAAFIVCDTWVFLNGYDSMFHTAKTPEEKALRAAIIKQKTEGIEP
jgi:predicted acetyltransferase